MAWLYDSFSGECANGKSAVRVPMLRHRGGKSVYRHAKYYRRGRSARSTQTGMHVGARIEGEDGKSESPAA